jgi:rhamnosyltransferase
MTPVKAVEASVIVRAKNEEGQIQRCLESLRSQTVPVEIVVVDSGSTDKTLDIASRYADHLIRILPDDFTFGRALNIGAAAASAEIHFALSAHCAASRDDWVARAIAHYRRDPLVAGTFGTLDSPNGDALDTPFVCSFPGVAEDPYWGFYWGFSNHASSWRASVWREFQFDEDIEAAEDREWSWRVMRAGYVIVDDPSLFVGLEHRRSAGWRALFRRTRREARAMSRLLPPDRPYSVATAVQHWWSYMPPGSNKPPAIRRLNPARIVEFAGRWAGERDSLAARRSTHPAQRRST